MTEPHAFTVGDIVYLKSGSPRMVVESVLDLPPVEGVADRRMAVNVVWSVYETNEIRRDSFPPEILRHQEVGR